jgi:steroid delta-isomerase-like uncharacterized protein
MATKDNKELVRKFWEVAEKGDYDAFGDYITEDSVDHSPMPGQPPGLEGVKYIFKMLKAAMPDFSQEIVDMVAEGDRVVVRAVSRGTHQGEMMGLPPTGKQVQIDEIHIVRVKDGKMTEHWGLVDQAALMAQLGLTPGGN